jgi:hypothetical protein
VRSLRRTAFPQRLARGGCLRSLHIERRYEGDRVLHRGGVEDGVVDEGWLRSGLETLLMGKTAAGVAYVVGGLLRQERLISGHTRKKRPEGRLNRGPERLLQRWLQHSRLASVEESQTHEHS